MREYECDPTIIFQMRVLVFEGMAISKVLRNTESLLQKVAGESQLSKIVLTHYAMEAFGLTFREAHPITGWFPFEHQFLDDAALEKLISPLVRAKKSEWALKIQN